MKKFMNSTETMLRESLSEFHARVVERGEGACAKVQRTDRPLSNGQR